MIAGSMEAVLQVREEAMRLKSVAAVAFIILPPLPKDACEIIRIMAKRRKALT